MLVDLVDGDDVRVIERGRGAGFLDEPPYPIGDAAGVRVQHLDGDGAAEARVHGTVDDTHAAVAELFTEAIVGQDIHGADGL